MLDYSFDHNHNRSVVTVVGEPEALKEAVIKAVGISIKYIDLNIQTGEHPRMGVTDVIPFIPITNVTMEETVEFSKQVAKVLWEKYNLPIYLYERAASNKNRENLSIIRKGQYEGLRNKMILPEWKPDFGETSPHPTAGVTAVGARQFLIAFNGKFKYS